MALPKPPFFSSIEKIVKTTLIVGILDLVNKGGNSKYQTIDANFKFLKSEHTEKFPAFATRDMPICEYMDVHGRFGINCKRSQNLSANTRLD